MALGFLPLGMIGNILLAALLGAMIGIERDLHGRPAGLRTNIIIAIASCLFTIISIEGFKGVLGADPTRIASQIVVGVGFLGAGALLRQEDHVLGLTTAADIWLVAAIGMAVAMHLYALAVTVTIIAVFCVWTLAPISHWLGRKGLAKSTSKKRRR